MNAQFTFASKWFITILILLNSITSPSFSQPSFTVSDKESASLLKTSTLNVVIKGQEESVLKKFAKKPDDLKQYQESINSFNSYLKEAVEKRWGISSEVKFISESEANQLKESRSSGHFLMELIEITNYKMGDFYHANQNSGSGVAKNAASRASDLAYHMSPSGNTSALAIIEASSPKKELAVSYLPAVGVSQGSVSFMVVNLKNQILDCTRGINSMSDLKNDIEKREAKLKEKTLLMFDPLISNALQKTIDNNKVKEIYPHPYEVTSFENANEIIGVENTKYAYIWVIPAGVVDHGQALFNYFIIDAADGRPLFLMGSSVAGAYGKFHQYHLTTANKRLKK